MRDRATRGASRRALLLHGAGAWGGQWTIWRRVLEAEGWQVDTPDLQPAASGIAATTLADYRAQVRAYASTQPDAFLLIGASLGGLLAVACAHEALRDGDDAASTARGAMPRPGALVLVNPLPPAPFAAALPADASDAPADAGDSPSTAAYAPRIRPWHSQARFDSTRRALSTSSFADQQIAFRHWRDESAMALREARAGLALPSLERVLAALPTLVIASDDDADVPTALSARFAASTGASLLRVPGTHVDPVMGASAAAAARAALAWFDGIRG